MSIASDAFASMSSLPTSSLPTSSLPVEIPLSLYVHMPWCIRKCPYCDFNSHELAGRRAHFGSGVRQTPDPTYIDALLEDFERELPLIQNRRIDSIFFGGGTPSLFQPDAFERLLRGVRTRACVAADVEVTMEVNPGAIERGAFADYREAGINRVSLGVQSFNSQALHRLGRIHSPAESERAVNDLHAAGLSNLNIDLMYALPGQSVAEALEDVRRACALGSAHLSHYQLTIEPGTVFHRCPPPIPDDDAAWDMQIECQAALASVGFRQYEISAYAQAGAECRHNLNYWSFGDYLGVGAGAHGKITLALPRHILRTTKPKSPAHYRTALRESRDAIGDRKFVASGELAFEFMLNTLRLSDGFSLRQFTASTGLDLGAVSERLSEAERRRWVEKTPAGWRASALGQRFLNDVQAAFLD